MADTKKVTKRDNFLTIRGIAAELGRTDLVEFCDHEMELLNKKHAKSGTPTKAQLENELVKGRISSALASAAEPMRSTALASEVGISVQKCTALLSQMVKAGTVKRDEDKKVTTFTLA